MKTYKAKLGDQIFLVPCKVLQEGETLLIDLPMMPPIINSACVQYVGRDELVTNE